MTFWLFTFRHGTAERVYRLEFVSNQPFTDSEFNKWRETMMLSDLKLPSVYDVEKKAAAIKMTAAYSYKETDIDEVNISVMLILGNCITFVKLYISLIWFIYQKIQI